jgi:hypothetical protein
MRLPNNRPTAHVPPQVLKAIGMFERGRMLLTRSTSWGCVDGGNGTRRDRLQLGERARTGFLLSWHRLNNHFTANN